MTVAHATHASTGDPAARHDDPRAAVDLEIVIPVYNEADQLAASITALRSYLDTSFPLTTTVTIADNASTDDTWRIATELSGDLPGVQALRLDQKGRGRALRTAWSASTAAVVAYMDVDLATGLDALLPLVAPLISGHSDLAIGTRLAPGAHVVRGVRREIISRGYNLLLRSALRISCTDAQCGFKALRREAAVEMLPLVEDDEWFFDTEVLVTAQRLGLRIHEVPVDWIDDTDSRVEVALTAWKDLRGVWRMLGPASRRRVVSGETLPPRQTATAPTAGRLALVSEPASDPESEPVSVQHTTERAGAPGYSAVFADELLRFAGAGVVNTAAYAALFALLEPGLGSYAANTTALALCTLGNTATHRGMAGSARHGLDRNQRMAVATGLFGISLGTTTAALAATKALGVDTLPSELAAVTSATALAAVLRFAVLRTWVFRPRFGSLPVPGPAIPPAEVGLDRTGPTTRTAS
jgi:putative flippase GtrA